MKTITYDETKWKLVPIEPTEEMIDASFTAVWFGTGNTPEHELERREHIAKYRWMVEAAPEYKEEQ